MTVSLLSPQDEESWNDFALSHPSSTIYHTLEWREVSQTQNHQAFYLIAKDKQNRLEGIFPLFCVKGIFGKRLVSVPLRDRGGPLFVSETVLTELLAAAQELTVQLSCKYLEIKNYEALPEEVISPNFEKVEHYVTTVVPLSPDTDTVWKRFDRVSVRQAIAKANREGVTARWAQNLDDVGEFYGLYLRTRKKLGVPPYPFMLFKAIWEIMGGADLAKLLLVDYQGLPIGGLLLFVFKDKAQAAYMAAHQSYLQLNPNNVLFWRAIEWACENGYRHFDFGASSPHQKGLIAFKSRWGGFEIRLPFYFYLNTAKSGRVLDSNAVHYRVFRRAWSKLPIPLARRLGPFFTRQMD